MTNATRPTDDEVREAQNRRREALIERIGTFADLLCSEPLPGPSGDVAYDLLRQAAAQISSDRHRLSRPAPAKPIAAEPGEVERVMYVQACGETVDAMREALLSDETGRKIYNRGDTVLVWINEADLPFLCTSFATLTAAEPRAAGEGALADELEHPDTLEFLVQYGGRCRDCADVGPVCESTGIGCGERRKAMKFALDALAYGVRNGFVLQAALRHRFASPQTAGEVGELVEVGERLGQELAATYADRGRLTDRVLSLTAERDAALERCEEAVRAEREECAKVADVKAAIAREIVPHDLQQANMATFIASAIRARAALGSGGGG
jgi:hypothetical protein